MFIFLFFFFFKQKTAYEMRISDWSSDVCSSDLIPYLVPIENARANDGFPPHVTDPFENVRKQLLALIVDLLNDPCYRVRDSRPFAYGHVELWIKAVFMDQIVDDPVESLVCVFRDGKRKRMNSRHYCASRMKC